MSTIEERVAALETHVFGEAKDLAADAVEGAERATTMVDGVLRDAVSGEVIPTDETTDEATETPAEEATETPADEATETETTTTETTTTETAPTDTAAPEDVFDSHGAKIGTIDPATGAFTPAA